MILFLGIWAGGAWIEPFGPEARGVAWLPFLFVALVLALIVVAVAPPTRRTPPSGRAATRQVGPVNAPESEAPEKARQERQEEALAVSFGAFFWFLVGLLVLAVFFAYL